MRLLLIETSTERAMTALVEGEKLLFQADLPFGYQHSRHLLPQIEAGLSKLHWRIPQLDAIAVGIGPGSYTGMRVGAMTAKTLSFSTGVPLVGLCTLHTFVGPATIIDAKIGGAYLAIGKGWPEILPLDKLGERLDKIDTLVTPEATALKIKLAAHYPDRQWQWEVAAPDPLQMARLARVKLANGEFTQEGQLELLYLREAR
jgi:tRNA threonylcarbamoyladenosine biosynthesis protein TsaB